MSRGVSGALRGLTVRVLCIQISKSRFPLAKPCLDLPHVFWRGHVGVFEHAGLDSSAECMEKGTRATHLVRAMRQIIVHGVLFLPSVILPLLMMLVQTNRLSLGRSHGDTLLSRIVKKVITSLKRKSASSQRLQVGKTYLETLVEERVTPWRKSLVSICLICSFSEQVCSRTMGR